MGDCVGEAVQTGISVGSVMAATAGLLGVIGSVITLPVTGGASAAGIPATASIVGGAFGVGAVSGAGAAGLRRAMGKPCKSPALPAVDSATKTMGGIAGTVIGVGKSGVELAPGVRMGGGVAFDN